MIDSILCCLKKLILLQRSSYSDELLKGLIALITSQLEGKFTLTHREKDDIFMINSLHESEALNFLCSKNSNYRSAMGLYVYGRDEETGKGIELESYEHGSVNRRLTSNAGKGYNPP